MDLFGDRFHDGLTDLREGRAEFFCQVRWLEPVVEASVEWSWPFLWYWRAVRQGDSWVYLDSAGRDVELARVHVDSPDQYVVEVQAMALRQYLHRRKMAMLIDIQLDKDHPEAEPVQREEHQLVSEWASMEFQVYSYDDILADGAEVAASSLHGQYVILPAENATGPAWCSDEEPEAYPDFVYALDPRSGRPLTVQPTRENAGSDSYPGPFFWTRIYFRPQVLDRYLAEPTRYTVTGSRVSCLHKWGLSIGRTSDGLIEVDLFDLSQMPWPEWSHWKTHNVPPAGGSPDQGKLRRERLNQPASSPDVVRDLRMALQQANDAALRLAGWPIWRSLAEPTVTEWRALHAPVVDDRAALQDPLLTLSKVLVDSIDSGKLRKALTSPPASDAKSLALLQQYIEQQGGTSDAVRSLKDLQELRSRGGFAHYAGSGANAVLTRIAGDASTPADTFTRICRNLIDALDSIAETLSSAEQRPTLSSGQH